MSAFLGPIHYWLYHKIQLQQSIVDELYELEINMVYTLRMSVTVNLAPSKTNRWRK
ncbi:MAG: hypothetical protein K0S76_523 [Herbinix sp.]|jgi:hypothetical protein|nr:hypothetical protein [Herbinix sp.]